MTGASNFGAARMALRMMALPRWLEAQPSLSPQQPRRGCGVHYSNCKDGDSCTFEHAAAVST